MNKIMKITIYATVLTVLAGGSAFARPMNNGHLKSDVKPRELPSNSIKNGYGRKNMTNIEDKVLIGVVKSIDEKTGKLTLTDADAKEEVVIVSPFTSVFTTERTEKDLSDIKTGKWVKVSLYKGDSKIPNAARVLIEK